MLRPDGALIKALREAVDADGGLTVMRMESIRKAYGVGRLGAQVRDEISSALAGVGLGHLPDYLPQYQEEEVRLYVLGSLIGQIAQAVLDPDPKGDKLLRSRGGSDPAQILDQIRALVAVEDPDDHGPSQAKVIRRRRRRVAA